MRRYIQITNIKEVYWKHLTLRLKMFLFIDLNLLLIRYNSVFSYYSLLLKARNQVLTKLNLYMEINQINLNRKHPKRIKLVKLN